MNSIIREALPAGSGNPDPVGEPLTETLERNVAELRARLSDTRGRAGQHEHQALEDWTNTLEFCRDQLYSRKLTHEDVCGMIQEFRRFAGDGEYAREQQGELDALAGRMRAQMEIGQQERGQQE